MAIVSRIIGTGSHLPEKIITNDELSKKVDTSDEWITERTGIRERRIAKEGESTSILAFQAAENALEAAGISSTDIDVIIVATTTPDNTFPSTATKVQAMLGMSHGYGFDIQAVCSGFIYALSVADGMIRSG
ncbi:MAG: 3-oxoacyl-ACP synthase, partial [Rhodospirillaceae bacterium]|nr:3-oxoacyl-ACP synthase [Rhodospirillaceae bacterium]